MEVKCKVPKESFQEEGKTLKNPLSIDTERSIFPSVYFITIHINEECFGLSDELPLLSRKMKMQYSCLDSRHLASLALFQDASSTSLLSAPAAIQTSA